MIKLAWLSGNKSRELIDCVELYVRSVINHLNAINDLFLAACASLIQYSPILYNTECCAADCIGMVMVMVMVKACLTFLDLA